MYKHRTIHTYPYVKWVKLKQNYRYPPIFPCLIRVSDTVWLMQNVSITRGVPRSMKFDPNLILSKDNDFISFFKWALFPLPFRIPSFRNFTIVSEELLILEASVKTKMIVPAASMRSRGNTKNPGMSMSWLWLRQTYREIIWRIGTPVIRTGMTRGRRKALKYFSKIWIDL